MKIFQKCWARILFALSRKSVEFHFVLQLSFRWLKIIKKMVNGLGKFTWIPFIHSYILRSPIPCIVSVTLFPPFSLFSSFLQQTKNHFISFVVVVIIGNITVKLTFLFSFYEHSSPFHSCSSLFLFFSFKASFCRRGLFNACTHFYFIVTCFTFLTRSVSTDRLNCDFIFF